MATSAPGGAFRQPATVLPLVAATTGCLRPASAYFLAMTDTRQVFLEAGAVVRDLLGSAELAAQWSQPSALAGFRISGLAGHLARPVLNIERFLAVPLSPDTPKLDLDTWQEQGTTGKNLDSPGHREVRERGERQAAAGPAALVGSVDAALARLAVILPLEDPSRWVDIFGLHALRLDDLLVSRLNELLVHSDDLAVSLGVPSPEFPPAAVRLVLGKLTDYAVRRHGAVAVLRALTRSERAPASISVY